MAAKNTAQQAKLKTINIKGKQYTQVFTRINFFRGTGEDGLVWDGGKGKDWSIEVDALNANEDIAHMKAIIKDETGRIRATGQAFESKAGSMINKTSHIENAETSAIGRALGNLGIGTSESFASTDEVSMAIAQQATQELESARAEIEALKQAQSTPAPRSSMEENWVQHFIQKMQMTSTVEEADRVLTEFTSFSNDPDFIQQDNQEFSQAFEAMRGGVPVNLSLGAISSVQKAYREKVSAIQSSMNYCNVLNNLKGSGNTAAIMALFAGKSAGEFFIPEHQNRIREKLGLLEFLRSGGISDAEIFKTFPFLQSSTVNA